MIHYYILDGHTPVPCDDLLVWAHWYEHADRHVAWTEFEDGTFVSTVFLGLDHSFSNGVGPPILFETMIGKHDRETSANTWEDHQWRYATWQEAEAGHKAAVKLVSLRLQHSVLIANDKRK